MKERLRPALAALLALLIGGDLATRGLWESLDLWRWLFPYLWLFLAFETLRARRRLRDFEAFLIGAAVGLFHDGVYVKSLQEGASSLGIDWLGAICAVFDWGMVTVLALHAARVLLPRDETPRILKMPELAGLVFLPGLALCGYLIRTFSGRYRYERMIGDTWLLADILFIIAAGALIRRALVKDPVIEVYSGETCGEAEYVLLIENESRIYVGLGSDHTDRKLEEWDIPRAKQICPNVIGETVWALEDVADHWDELSLRCRQIADGQEILYQEGKLARLMAPGELMAFVRSKVGTPLDGTIIFSGTLAALTGGFVYGTKLYAELTDPKLNRRLAFEYDIHSLDSFK